MLGRIKYWLLRRLLDDICSKSECIGAYEDCAMNFGCDLSVNGKVVKCSCLEDFVFKQARKAWGIEARNPRNKQSI